MTPSTPVSSKHAFGIRRSKNISIAHDRYSRLLFHPRDYPPIRLAGKQVATGPAVDGQRFHAAVFGKLQHFHGIDGIVGPIPSGF